MLACTESNESVLICTAPIAAIALKKNIHFVYKKNTENIWLKQMQATFEYFHIKKIYLYQLTRNVILFDALGELLFGENVVLFTTDMIYFCIQEAV